MAQRDSFSGCHPGLNMLYFAAVLAVTMLCAHPVTLAISFGAACIYCIQLCGWNGFGRRCLWLVPMMAMAALINPLFSHEGATILTYLPSGNPLTLESILYGLAAAVILGAAVLWFGCMTAVLTTDKFVWLFGRLLPALSLLLSMTLRFVPRLVRQFGQVRQDQQCVGRDISRGSVLRRVGIADCLPHHGSTGKGLAQRLCPGERACCSAGRRVACANRRTCSAGQGCMVPL